MFFQTYEKTELKSPFQDDSGERMWPFVELGLPLPLYLMRLESGAKGETIGHEILTANVQELLNFAQGRYRSLRLLAVDLLFNSPSQARRSFHKLKELWSAPKAGVLRFIVDDDIALDLDLTGRGLDASQVELERIFRSPEL